MAKEERELLENIAVDMVALSMEYIGTPRSEIKAEVMELSDAQLLDYITK